MKDYIVTQITETQRVMSAMLVDEKLLLRLEAASVEDQLFIRPA